MKPRIIILMHYLELGGAEMSLLGLLGAVDPKRVDVDLFIYSHQGPLMKFIPEWVNLLPEQTAYSVIERPIKEAITNGQFRVVLGRLIAKWQHRKFQKKFKAIGDDASIYSYIGKYLTPQLPSIESDKEYDLCISYLLPHNYALNKVKAKKYVAWIHTDYSKMTIDANLEKNVWCKFNHIISISDDVKKSFINVFPELEKQIIGMENILPKEYILKRSNEFDASNEFDGSPILLSVGRFSYAKNYDNLPDIAKRLVTQYGYNNLRWYIIGFGGDEELIRSKIKEAGMEDHVIILGKKENPYPYIKACDIYVQPSRYEGKSITVREAQLLGKPVVITNYPTAPSQINDGLDGVIVPLDNEECAKGISDFIRDIEKQNSIRGYLSSHDYAGITEVSKIYQILNIL